MDFLAHADVRSERVCRGTVAVVGKRILVLLDESSHEVVSCEILYSSETPLVLAEGDHVIVWRVEDGGSDGIVLGRIGPRSVHTAEPEQASRAQTPRTNDDLPDTLVIEAKHSLTLRVGDGSITIREDGKILIKGKDLVSHAQRMNRIKGGAVSIN